jgi:hypothetical protein
MLALNCGTQVWGMTMEVNLRRADRHLHSGPGDYPPGRGTVRQPDRRPEGTTARRVLTIVACGAGPAVSISTCVKLAQDRGWTVQVTATPAALEIFDQQAIADQSGSPVRSKYAKPGSPRSLVPDARPDWQLPLVSRSR